MDVLSGATGNTLTPPACTHLMPTSTISTSPKREGELITNQRFEKLCRLEQQGIFCLSGCFSKPPDVVVDNRRRCRHSAVL
jgi:hypothetical protein